MDEATASWLIDKLGGNKAVAELCDVGVSAVSNWRAWNRFPPRVFLPIDDACRKKKIATPRQLFKEAAQQPHEAAE